jgi:hypothetical protein
MLELDVPLEHRVQTDAVEDLATYIQAAQRHSEDEVQLELALERQARYNLDSGIEGSAAQGIRFVRKAVEIAHRELGFQANQKLIAPRKFQQLQQHVHPYILDLMQF